MTQPSTVTVPPSLLKSLKTFVLSTLGMVGGIIGIAIGLTGVGPKTFIACAVVAGLGTVLYLIGAFTQRPRVVITSEGFALHRLFGSLTHKWEEIDGQFAVTKIGWNKAVVYKLTADYKALVGKKAPSGLSGYDGAIMGSFQLSAEELAALLNEHRVGKDGA